MKPFLVEHPDALARMTDEDQKFVTDEQHSIRNRAEREWGSRIPFTKRDPPVCL